MKTLKIFLCSFLLVHIFIILVINFNGFKYFDSPDYSSSLNNFGQRIVKNSDNYLPSKEVKNYFRTYATYLGVERGYSFFSPNVSNSSIELLFVDNNGTKLEIPFNSSESELKFTTADSYLESYLLGNDEVRDRILKSFSRWLFSYNPDISSIKIYLKLSHYENIESDKIIEEHMKEEVFFGFTVERNKLKQL